MDKDFNITGFHTFESLPTGMSFNDGKLYVSTAKNGIYSSDDGENYTSSQITSLPENEEPVPALTLGDLLDNEKLSDNDHTVGFYGYERTYTKLTDSEYRSFYNAVKDIKLKASKNGYTGVRAVDIDGLDIFASQHTGIEYSVDDKLYTYTIADEQDITTVENLLSELLSLGANAKAALDISDWAKEDIELSFDYGLIPYDILDQAYFGASEKFDDGITRRNFCRIAARAIELIGSTELPNVTGSKFNDLEAYDSANALSALGIITGYEDGSFRPDNKITREEAAVILSRLISLYGLNTETQTDFSDNAQIQDWAMSGLNITCNYGIMNGVGNNLFDPQGTYTVEQSVITLLRTFDTVVNAGYLKLPAIPDGGNSYTVYREGYRNDRLELAVYDTESDSVPVIDNGVLSVSGSYKNDKKYYFSLGRWIEFESGYERISNSASAVILSGKR